MIPSISEAPALPFENAKSIKATEGVAVDNQRVVDFDEAGACNPGNYTVSVSWGDGTAPTPGTVFKALDSSPGTCSYGANGSHTYAAAARLTVTATVCNVTTKECITTPVGGQVNVAAATIATTAAPAPAAAATPEPAPAAAADQPAAPVVTANPVATPALRVLGPVTLSQLRHAGLRLRLRAGAAATLTLTVRLADPASGRTLARVRVHLSGHGAAAGADTILRVRFPHKALRRVRHGHRYALRIPGGGGLPSLAAQFSVR